MCIDLAFLGFEQLSILNVILKYVQSWAMGYEILPDSALSDSSQATYLRLRHLQVTQLLTRFELMLIPGNAGAGCRVRSNLTHLCNSVFFEIFRYDFSAQVMALVLACFNFITLSFSLIFFIY